MSEAAFSGIFHIINIYIFLNIQRNLIKVLIQIRIMIRQILIDHVL